MSIRVQRANIQYSSHRTDRGAPKADFVAAYRPTGAVYHSQPGALDHWLTERYCLYAADRRGSLYRADIHHAPWPLQPAEAQINVNTMAAAQGIPLPDTAPVLYYAHRLDVAIWLLRKIG